MNSRRWLIFSLALNLALAGVVAWAAFGRPGVRTPLSVAQQLTHRTLRVGKIVRESAPVLVEVTTPFHWSEVESTDYRVYMTNLRTIGCPERTIRDIILADVDQLYAARLRELLAPLHREFWQLLARFDQMEEAGKRYEKAWAALKEEREAMFTELLGDADPFRADKARAREAREPAQWAHRLDFLTPEKRQAVLALRASFDQTRQQLWPASGQLTKEEREERGQKQRELEADRDRQLAAALTSEELAEYRLRSSPGAEHCLRETSVVFSEDDFETITRATVQRQEEEAKLGQNTPEASRQREEVRQRSEAQIKEALGEGRYADYQRAGDHRFEQIALVTERYGMPEQTALAVYAMRREAEDQGNLIRQDNNRSAEKRSALLQAISAETERSVREALGEKAFTTYQKRGGNWIASLNAPGK